MCLWHLIFYTLYTFITFCTHAVSHASRNTVRRYSFKFSFIFPVINIVYDWTICQLVRIQLDHNLSFPI